MTCSEKADDRGPVFLTEVFKLDFLTSTALQSQMNLQKSEIKLPFDNGARTYKLHCTL